VTAFVPHSPRVLSASFVSALPPWIYIDIVFDVVMDTASTPDVSHWDLLYDGASKPILSFSWKNPTTLTATVIGTWPPTSSCSVRLLTVDEDCKDTDGNIAFAPQVVEFFP